MLFGVGSPEASIMIVGEAFTYLDQRNGQPFSGGDGQTLNEMLREAGILVSNYRTCLYNAYPPFGKMENLIFAKKKDWKGDLVPLHGLFVTKELKEHYDRLKEEIRLVNPEVIIAVGEWAMWALTGARGIDKWRGSNLNLRLDGRNATATVIPILPPYRMLGASENRHVTVHDLTRIHGHLNNTIPPLNWNFTVRPTFDEVMGYIGYHLCTVEAGTEQWIDFDLETRAGHIACAGLSWSTSESLCIPLMCQENTHGYWTVEEESRIVYLLYQLLTHPNCKVRGQNLLYDCQYTYRHWHFVPNVVQDTMISWHTCHPGLPKSLAFQSSITSPNYIYWKDDGKTWNADVGEDQLWYYNCTDCVRTREVGEGSQATLATMGLESVDAIQQQLFWPILRAMQLGVRIDIEARKKFDREVEASMTSRQSRINYILGHPINLRSTVQMQALFYNDLRQSPVMSKATKYKPPHITCDDHALDTIAKREPLLRPLCSIIQEYRSLGVFLSTFIRAELDIDQRMRCSYNPTGTETYRLNSSTNAFGCGTNLQNIPKGDEDGGLLPNIRQLFIPDHGYTFFDLDLDRADLQVVAWEADEFELKVALKKGVDMHLLNAASIFGYDVDMDLLIEGTESHERYKREWKRERQFAKSWVHGTDYGGSARTMAIAAGCTVHESDRAQRAYFGRYPGIKRWHGRVEKSLHYTHTVTNILGYRRIYYGSVDKILPEALAWIPQSTVACIINQAWINIYNATPQIQVLLQVHDSLAGQFPTYIKEDCISLLKQNSKILLPYSDPLTIPTSVKTSQISWGDCE